MGTTAHLIIITALMALASSMPQQQTTPRTPQQIGETIKALSTQLMDVNITSSDVVLDTRTPPRIRLQQQKSREKVDERIVENSHAGIAIPIDEDALILEEQTKKLHFYKIDRPTTDRGLSTWILLSGHTSPTSTTKTSKKPPIKQNSQQQNTTLLVTDTINKIKPLFKKKPTVQTTTTTEKITTTTSKKILITNSSSEKVLTKIKASLLSSAQNKTKKGTQDVETTTKANAVQKTKATTKPFKSESKTAPKQEQKLVTKASFIKQDSKAPTTNNKDSKATITKDSNKSKTNKTSSTAKPDTKSVELIKVSDSNSLVSSQLPLESKNGEMDLNNITTTTSPKKTRRPNKRKKNKNRRKRPSIDRADTTNSTNTKLANTKQKPISTQIYNYLSREVMPTVGVGLVGLMVTAGLASYFLYPFGSLRRSYDIDRKDKDSSYYYHDDYAGGIAEEQAIGKVIAGMPYFSNTNYPAKNNYPIANVLNSNVRYRQVDHRHSGHSLDSKYKNPNVQHHEEVVVQNMYVPQQNPHYTKEILEKNDNKFVVGNVPKEYLDEATPIAVPEHGPRSLKLRRRRRRQVDYNENDIFSDGPSMIHNNAPYGTVVSNSDKNNHVTSGVTIQTTLQHVDDQRETSERPIKEEVATKPGTLVKPGSSSNPGTTSRPGSKPGTSSFIDLFKDILQLKIKMGLELLQNTTQTISRYITRIQQRVQEKS